MPKRKEYDPSQDPAVKAILKAKTEAERKAVEREVVQQTDNRPQDSDPPQRGKPRKK